MSTRSRCFSSPIDPIIELVARKSIEIAEVGERDLTGCDSERACWKSIVLEKTS